MSDTINYHLVNELGEEVAVVSHKQKDLTTVIISHKGKFYRPLHYDLNTMKAICVEVTVINGDKNNEATFRDKSLQSIFAGASKS